MVTYSIPSLSFSLEELPKSQRAVSCKSFNNSYYIGLNDAEIGLKKEFNEEYNVKGMLDKNNELEEETEDEEESEYEEEAEEVEVENEEDEEESEEEVGEESEEEVEEEFDEEVEEELEEEEIIEEDEESSEDSDVIKYTENKQDLPNKEQTTESEVDFWAEIEQSREKSPVNDPTKYPEEPREVDTEEEIDFWAEIECNRRQSNDHIDYRKAAMFWSNKDEETKKPVLPKALFVEAPEERDLNYYELENYKGEEPIFINSETLEEQVQLVDEPEQAVKDDKKEQKIEEQQQPVEQTCENNINHAGINDVPTDNLNLTYTQSIDKENTHNASSSFNDVWNKSEEKEEVILKRCNYRKAMAFFSTPIDENKEKIVEKSKESLGFKDNNKQTKQQPIKNECISEESENLKPEALEIQQSSCKTLPKKLLSNGLPDLNVTKYNEEQKISVRDRVFAFETNSFDKAENNKTDKHWGTTLSVESYSPHGNLSRNSSQRSESEMEEEDSGVTDMNRQLSETDTESESFPELRKMSSYQRASTHSRLFKLLQEDDLVDNQRTSDEFQMRPSRRKIVHNVSITRKQNPQVLNEAESMAQRRERLSLPLQNNKSIDADNPSTPNSPASPIMGNPAGNQVVSDKLVKELVQSLLLRSDSSQFKELPMAKLQAAAKRALEEELDSLENTSVDTTPVRSFDDYHDTWSDATSGNGILPSKAFRVLQEKSNGRKSPWSVRCPRVLSSKTVNSDLARVTESPEITTRNSNSPECFTKESSINRWKKY